MEEAARDPLIAAKLGGMEIQHLLSTCMAAMPVDSDGVPFNCSHVYATGNIAADMLANATAESTGRMLAVQLYRMTDDPGMKDMLSYLIARDTMHQNQWLAAWEEVGGRHALPIPNEFPQEQENSEFNYSFLTFGVDGGSSPPEGRWTTGDSFDGKGHFSVERMQPRGEKPILAPAPDAPVQSEQLMGAAREDDSLGQKAKRMVERVTG
jgi:Mn-containing catalase